MSARSVLQVASFAITVGLALSGCETEATTRIVEVTVPVQVETTREVPLEVRVEVPVEVVVTSTPEPPPPDAVVDFDAVPEEVLVQVCEDVKQAVQYDDDTRTLTIRLAAPFGPFLQLLSNGWASPLDMEWMVEHGEWDGDCATWVEHHDPSAEDSPIFEAENGTGPFRLDYWVHGEEMSALRWDDYWRTDPMWEGGPSGPAFYERLVETTVADWGTRLLLLQAGDVDWAFVPQQYLETADHFVAQECDYRTGECTHVNPDGLLRVYKGLPGLIAMDFAFTMDIAPESLFIGSGQLDGDGVPTDFFSDIHIRKAFAFCFDNETYIQEAARGEALQRNGPIIAGMTGYDPQDPPPQAFDLQACEEQFKAADLDHDGIPAGEDEDDVWERGFFMIFAYMSGADDDRVAMEILKANLEAINPEFDVELLPMTWPAYLRQVRSQALPLTLVGWLEDYHHPHNWVQPYLSSTGALGHSLGLPEGDMAEFETMIREARLLSDPVQQHEAYKAIQRRAAETQAYIWGQQPTMRYYEQLWSEGWFYNPAFPCPFVYGLAERDDSPDPFTYVSAGIGEPETLDPAFMYDANGSCWAWRLYDPLVHLKRESIDEFVGQLADRWEISDDGLTYTFHIREGVGFHEGGDLDAHDAAYAIWRGLLQDRAGGPQWMFWDAILGRESVEGYAIEKANEALGL